MTVAAAEVVHVSRDDYLATVQKYREDGYAMCADVCAVDYLTNHTRVLPDDVKPERFEVVTNLLSFEPPRRVRIRVQLPADDPRIASLFDIYPGVEAM